jgi:hypothetical protein
VDDRAAAGWRRRPGQLPIHRVSVLRLCGLPAGTRACNLLSLLRLFNPSAVVAFRPPPERHWRSYGTDPLPSRAEALGQPFAAFPSWFLRIECDRCGKVVMINESHFGNRHTWLRQILDRMRHDGWVGSQRRPSY